MHKLSTHLSFISIICLIKKHHYDWVICPWLTGCRKTNSHRHMYTWKNKEVFQAPVELWESMSTHSCSTTAIALRYMNLIQPFLFNCAKAEEHGNSFSLVFERECRSTRKWGGGNVGGWKAEISFHTFLLSACIQDNIITLKINYSSAQAWCNVQNDRLFLQIHIIQSYRSGLIVIQWDNLLDHNK